MRRHLRGGREGGDLLPVGGPPAGSRGGLDRRVVDDVTPQLLHGRRHQHALQVAAGQPLDPLRVEGVVGIEEPLAHISPFITVALRAVEEGAGGGVGGERAVGVAEGGDVAARRPVPLSSAGGMWGGTSGIARRSWRVSAMLAFFFRLQLFFLKLKKV